MIYGVSNILSYVFFLLKKKNKLQKSPLKYDSKYVLKLDLQTYNSVENGFQIIKTDVSTLYNCYNFYDDVSLRVEF